MVVLAATSVVGDGGQGIVRGMEIPSEWSPEFVKSLIESGGAIEVPSYEAVDELLAQWQEDGLLSPTQSLAPESKPKKDKK